MTREEWLSQAVEKFRPIFKEADVTLPEKIRISIGWMGGRGTKRSTIGQCWDPSTVADKTPAVFISPVLNDPIQILSTVAHELVHASGRMNHRKEFSELAKKIGLVKPWTATSAGPELKIKLEELASELGELDHAAIRRESIKVQTTRLIKVMCHRCGYTIRVTAKWIDVGFPTCPCGEEMDYG